MNKLYLYVSTILGQLPPEKIAPNLKTNPNPSPNPNPNWGELCSGKIVRIPFQYLLNCSFTDKLLMLLRF